MVPLPEDTVKEMRKAPAAAFESPAAVVTDGRLSHRQKQEILEAWAHDCREQAVADDEGMPPRGPRPVRLKEVEDAINALSGGSR